MKKMKPRTSLLFFSFWSLDLLAAIQGITLSSETFFLQFAQILEYFVILLSISSSFSFRQV
jgi:hypothetical protein